ncbi:MAG: ATP-binding cassette domain-containing protein [Pirellulaceae bacterium]|nr:ATP-binding cassette domain-containing protein [Pirellulaceae bacterium]
MNASAIPSTTAAKGKPPEPGPILEVRDLRVHFPFRRGGWFLGQPGVIRAVDGVSLEVFPGETLGLVGESGCGKSTTARAIVGLLERADMQGEIRLAGERIDDLSPRAMLPHRRVVQMIFQDPFASLNPRMTVGAIIGEPLAIMSLGAARDRKFRVMELMDLVGLNPKYLNRYPHEFSGGQRQRIGIARALAVEPRLIICDEPVSALDVSIQAQVINLLMELQQRLGVAYLFISHDLSVVRHISHRIGVMYLGRIVETAPADEIHRRPLHPYTQALLSAAPIPDPIAERKRQRIILRGEVPSPDRAYPGCPFADRCPLVEAHCREVPPRLEGSGHQVSCHLVDTSESVR